MFCRRLTKGARCQSMETQCQRFQLRFDAPACRKIIHLFQGTAAETGWKMSNRMSTNHVPQHKKRLQMFNEVGIPPSCFTYRHVQCGKFKQDTFRALRILCLNCACFEAITYGLFLFLFLSLCMFLCVHASHMLVGEKRERQIYRYSWEYKAGN